MKVLLAQHCEIEINISAEFRVSINFIIRRATFECLRVEVEKIIKRWKKGTLYALVNDFEILYERKLIAYKSGDWWLLSTNCPPRSLTRSLAH